MRIQSLFIPFIITMVVLLSCNKNTVSLSYTNAKGEVPVLGNLIFRFNQSMIKDSLLNAWDSTDYVSFEPAIKGRFRWESPDQLIFSPSQPLNPATTYKAKVRNTVLRYSKYNDVKEADKIEFHTPDLQLENSQILWIGEKSTTAVPQIDLHFNYHVNPSELKENLKVEVEDEQADFNVITMSPDNKISLRIHGMKVEDKDYAVRVTVNKGLKPVSGANEIKEPITTSLSLCQPIG